MKYRYNVFSFVKIENEKIIITCQNGLKKINITNNSWLSKFLDYIWKHIFFWNNEIKKFWMSKEMIDLLLTLNVVDYYDNISCIESFSFNQLTKNPNFLREKSNQKYIDHIYQNLWHRIDVLLWSDFYAINKGPKKLLFSIKNAVFDNIKSTRLKRAYKSKSNIEILNIIRYIFSKRNNWNENNFYFWSWWWLYSIFPLIISKNDEVFVYDKFYQQYYTKKIKNIRQKILKNWFIECNTKFWAYDYIVFLISDTKNIGEKYGNKSYKLILLEAWQISFLFRLFCSNFDKAQLEIQWFYDDKILKILLDENILNKNKLKHIMLLHTLALSK